MNRQAAANANGTVAARQPPSPNGDDALGKMLSLLHRVAYATSISILVSDPCLPDNPIVFHNPAFEKISGYAAHEITGRNCRFLQGVDTDPEAVATIRRAIADETPCRVVLRNYRKDGTAFLNELSLSPIHDEHGRLTHFIGLQNDVPPPAEVQSERDALLAEQKNIVDTLKRALLLTASVVPSGIQVGTRYAPASNVPFGGDFFDTISLPGDKVALVVGDCAGHGLKAAEHTAEVKYALRVLLHEYGHPTPALHRLNTFLLDSKRYEGQGQAAIVCACVAVVDTRTGAVSVAVAGMEPPLIVRADGTAEAVESGGMVLGVTDTLYAAQNTMLGAGDTLIMVTDGVTEARSPKPNRDMFGYGALTVVAQQAVAESLSPDAISERIVASAKAFASGMLQDDVCVLVARQVIVPDNPDASGDGETCGDNSRSSDLAQFALDVTGLGYWELDTATGDLRRSPRHDRIFGYHTPPATQTYTQFLSHIHADDFARVDALYARALASGTDWRFECRIVRTDGAERWIEARGRHFRDANRGDAPTRIIGTVADVSERKQAEAEHAAATDALNAERELLSAALEAMPYGAILAEAPSGRLVYRNKNAVALLGNDSIRLLDAAQYAHLGAFHADDAGNPTRPYAVSEYPLIRAVNGETITDHELLYCKGDDTFVWLAVTAAPLGGAGATPVLAIATFNDITERKEAERRERFLCDLSERVRNEDDPDTILYEAARMVGRFTGANRALFAEVANGDTDAATFTVHRDFVQGGITSLAGMTFAELSFGRDAFALARSGAFAVSEDVHADDRITLETQTAYAQIGIRAYAAAPILRNGKWVSVLVLNHDAPRTWSLAEREMLRDVAERTRLAVDNARLLRGEREAAARQRAFLREMLFGLTEGRLYLCDTVADLPAPLPTESEPVPLSPQTLRLLRKQVTRTADEMAFATERAEDFETAVGEAGMNAIGHAENGVGIVRTDTTAGTIQVWIRDEGEGIAEHLIHRAVERGWTAGGFGQGMFLMHRTCDRFYLLTGTGGTTVVLELDRTPPAPTWMRNDYE